MTLQDQFVLCAWCREQQKTGLCLVLIITATYSKVKEETLVPLLCASIWEMELTVTLQTGQWRWALLCLGSLSSSVRCSPFVLVASVWPPDSVVGAVASTASKTSAVLASEPASDSCEEGEIWGEERATSSTVDTSDTSRNTTAFLGASSCFTSWLAGPWSDWGPAQEDEPPWFFLWILCLIRQCSSLWF